MESPIISMVGPGGRCGGEVRRGGACGFLSGGMVLVAVARLVWRGPSRMSRPLCPREVEPCGISRGRESQGTAAGEVGLSSSSRIVKRFSIWTGEGGPMDWLTRLAAASVVRCLLLAVIQASCVSGEKQARVGTGRWSSNRARRPRVGIALPAVATGPDTAACHRALEQLLGKPGAPLYGVWIWGCRGELLKAPAGDFNEKCIVVVQPGGDKGLDQPFSVAEGEGGAEFGCF
ncbi:hypothetical protein Q8A73_012443 [Channa argus]|nr:hypothetical protein Q8A73_012443 [Channa argus]